MSTSAADLTPATFGQRTLTRLITIVVTLVVGGALWAPAILTSTSYAGGEDPWLAIGGAVIGTAVGIFLIYLMLAKGMELGSLMTGVVNVDATTGEPGGGPVLIKFLLQFLIGTVTLGLGWLFTLFLQPPTNQNWYDRTAGVLVITRR